MSERESIDWISVQHKLPDEDETVLTYVPEARGEPIWLGYYAGKEDGWTQIDGWAIAFPVTHWAPMPRGPHGPL